MMSFALTQDQVRARTKTVTRRFGWYFLKPGDLVLPVEKAMGLKKGEKAKPLCGPIRIVSTRAEMLCDIDDADVVREGFPEMRPHEFVDMLSSHYRDPALSYATVNRIEFEYT
jgi:hypothetical protein